VALVIDDGWLLLDVQIETGTLLLCLSLPIEEDVLVTAVTGWW
jgi:hypothetical protein